ncbi:MAG: hypothetical protein J2P18_18105 [Nocardia sp.]|nr:hypothetical protein [Nocardia sp.]
MTAPEGPRLICISGGDASGKSTQVEALTAALSERGEKVAAVTIWDALSDPYVAQRLPFRDRGQVYEYLRILSPRARTHFMFHALHVALDRAFEREPDLVLLNAYWYKYFATEIAHGGDTRMLRSWAYGFPEPESTFYLRITPEIALARKRQRSDYESGYGDAAAFLDFQWRSLAILGQLCAELNWIDLDGTAKPSTLTATMLEVVESGGLR